MAKAKQASIEEQMKTMQKQFGAIVMTVKDLKISVVSLEKKVDDRQIKEIQEILEKQKGIEKVISANSDAIQRLDEELLKKVKERLARTLLKRWLMMMGRRKGK